MIGPPCVCDESSNVDAGRRGDRPRVRTRRGDPAFRAPGGRVAAARILPFRQHQDLQISDIVSDPTAPVSPPQALRIIFTTDMARDSEPGVHWIGLPAVKEVYAGWSVKWSPNWACSPAGCGKIAFFHTAAEGEVYIGYGDFGRTSNPKTISVNTLWAPYQQRVWPANRALTTINPGTWYRIEWYQKYASSASAADGVMRWWVDGVLNGDYGGVRFPSARLGLWSQCRALWVVPSTSSDSAAIRVTRNRRSDSSARRRCSALRRAIVRGASASSTTSS